MSRRSIMSGPSNMSRRDSNTTRRHDTTERDDTKKQNDNNVFAFTAINPLLTWCLMGGEMKNAMVTTDKR